MTTTTTTGGPLAGIPGWEKGLIILAGLTITGFIGYKIYKGAKSLREQKGSREEQAATQNELAALNKAVATKQTISKAQALAMANAIFTAMDGYGTDSAAILKQLVQLKNQADWLALSDAFGIREISSGALNPEPNFKGTLSGALTSELGTADKVWTGKVNAMFISKGIKTVI